MDESFGDIFASFEGYACGFPSEVAAEGVGFEEDLRVRDGIAGS